jgi:hypothetical protein
MNKGNCPICGKKCDTIVGYPNDELEIRKVTGICPEHGYQDLTSQGWKWQDFDKDLARMDK